MLTRNLYRERFRVNFAFMLISDLLIFTNVDFLLEQLAKNTLPDGNFVTILLLFRSRCYDSDYSRWLFYDCIRLVWTFDFIKGTS